MTTAGPTRRQILISLGPLDEYVMSSVLSAAQAALCAAGSALTLWSVRPAYSGLSITTSTVATPDEISVVADAITWVRQVPAESMVCLPCSHSYLRVRNVPLMANGFKVTPSQVAQAMDSSPLAPLFTSRIGPVRATELRGDRRLQAGGKGGPQYIYKQK